MSIGIGEYTKFYTKSVKLGEPLFIHMHDAVFKNIYLIELKENKYFKYKVFWEIQICSEIEEYD